MTQQNENIKKYIGITIGPIAKTISLATETGQLWGSSYIFSYMMKNIIKNIICKKEKVVNKEVIDKEIADRIILPYISQTDTEFFNIRNEIGIFCDRFIFEAKDGDFEKAKSAVEKSKNHFADRTLDLIKERYSKEYEENEEKDIKSYCRNYFKIYIAEVTVNLNDEDENKSNPILRVQNCLDVLELRENYIPEEKENYILKIIENSMLKNKKTINFLTQDAYGANGRDKFPSLFNIAARGLGIEPNDSEEDKDVWDEINEILKSIEDNSGNKYMIKKAYEYAAIVQADGDFIGKHIRDLWKNRGEKDAKDVFQNFSKCLYDFDIKARDIIKVYGGFPIYAGGDDFLFIAPVINNNSLKEDKIKNIFDLIEKLSDDFNFENNAIEKPTLSFGVAIAHHKFPLYYSLDEARNLLEDKAKKFKSGDKRKNATAVKVIMKSGQAFELIFNKQQSENATSYKCFRNLMTQVFNSDLKFSRYLKALHIKLLQDKSIINLIGKDVEKLRNYFINNFNEEIHKSDEIKNYLYGMDEGDNNEKLGVMGLINQVFLENTRDDIKNDKAINQVYSYLKFIRFIDEEVDARKEGAEDE